MTVSVWADVGGTFTDCIVCDGTSKRQTKVLSTGIVRAAASMVDKRTLQLRSLPASQIRQFWRDASASVIHEDGTATAVGVVVNQEIETVSLSQEIPFSPSAGTSFQVELNAQLEAPVLAARILLGIPLDQPLPALDVRMGTTRGTNALLTRRGAVTGLLVTRGFRDLLLIGEQDRPELFQLAIVKPIPLTDRVVEVDERIDAEGKLLTPIDLKSLEFQLRALRLSGVESLAICLLHAHVNDAHELLAEQLAKQIGFAHISRSSEVAPLIKLVSRAETTLLDAYLDPILSGYVATVWAQFGGSETCRLRLMTSSGNLVAPAAFRGRDSILSGPAGGVVALAHVAAIAGTDQAIGLDMGGTSTDVSRFGGRVGRRYESRVAGVRVMTPMMDIETIAAGGGSICDVTADGRMVVGPASAGADPGPACYGRGGPLTVTDVNLLLGRVPVRRFPFPLHLDASKRKLASLRAALPSADRFVSDQALAEGFLKIAVTHMAEAVRTVSTAQGTDVRKLALVGFGGAAGQHICRVAKLLGIRRIIDHPDAGLMSALGMGLADVGRVVTRGVYQRLSDTAVEEIDAIATELKANATDLLAVEHGTGGQCRFDLSCDLRYLGTESSLSVACEPRETLANRFHQLHHTTFGYDQRDRPIELVAIRCEATIPSAPIKHSYPSSIAPSSAQTIPIWHQDGWVNAVCIDRHSLRPADTIAAPALVIGAYSTLLVEPGWIGKVIAEGTIELNPVSDPEPTALEAGCTDSVDDPVLLEVVARRLQGIADSMGEVLRRTAISVNIKERRDYSCAVFRGDGSLVANAPHVPVHLGAMGHTVRHLMRTFPVISRGDCFLSNDPFAGGSHLPDLTVVTPVFCDGQRSPTFFVASRAHHAEIGGRTPGSMPPDAVCLAEEGVVIRDFALVRCGHSNIDQLRSLLSSGPYPSRSVDENLADVAAQQAAGAFGVRALRELADDYAPQIIDALMSRLLSVAADSMQRWIETLDDHPKQFSDTLDDGSLIAVTIERKGKRLAIDFATAGVHPHGFNATPAIVTAAVLYVLRTVSGSDLPLCDGVLRDVDLHVPVGILNPPADPDPEKCAAVVAGNVETSQRIVDVLLGALGVAAASQGTMNNVLMGNDAFGYYETIGGGSGATSDSDGADAVHTHMTNTRITDPEVLESRLPVRLIRFQVRRGSGGAGLRRGGDGILREFQFLQPLVVSLLTSRRTTAPYGVAGGKPGESGRNTLIQGKQTIDLPPTATIHVQPGDRLRINTPGGGGWGN